MRSYASFVNTAFLASILFTIEICELFFYSAYEPTTTPDWHVDYFGISDATVEVRYEYFIH